MQKRKKTFVIDTSVLIHDPNSVTSFEDNHVRLPVEVIHEIDRLKTEPGERGRAARSVQRNLLKLFGEQELTKPTPTPGGGTLAVLLPKPTGPTKSTPPQKGKPQQKRTPGVENPLRALGKMDINDHHIIAAAFHLQRGENATQRVILVTKDMGMILKARSIGITTQDYRHDKTQSVPDVSENPLPAKPGQTDALIHQGIVSIPELAKAHSLRVNQYVLLGEKKYPARHEGEGQFIRLRAHQGVEIQGGIKIHPRNLGQQFLIDALLDPEISLVTVRGCAGTGKTLLSIAAAIHCYQQRIYNKILIAKPIISSGGDLGALPGTLEEKMRPWLQGYADALDYLFQTNRRPENGPQEKQMSQRKKPRQGQQNHREAYPPQKPRKPYDSLIESGTLQIEALSYIRGRSIPKSIFLFDECQNLTPMQAKTIVTRIAKGSKIVLLGDEDQIDNPYVDRLSNGLTYVRNRMDNLPQCAHILLTKGERSEISEIAAKLL